MMKLVQLHTLENILNNTLFGLILNKISYLMYTNFLLYSSN